MSRSLSLAFFSMSKAPKTVCRPAVLCDRRIKEWPCKASGGACDSWSYGVLVTIDQPSNRVAGVYVLGTMRKSSVLRIFPTTILWGVAAVALAVNLPQLLGFAEVVTWGRGVAVCSFGLRFRALSLPFLYPSLPL